MYTFLHTADIHLDSPLLNLDRYDGAPVEAFRSATRRALDKLVELALAERVRFVLIAGDLYDGDCRDFNTPLHFRCKMRELAEHGISVLVIQGNHDAENKMHKAFSLQLPGNVHLFRTDRPETVFVDDLNVAIHGQGFWQRDVTDDISQNYPAPLRGWLNIGMLHTSCGAYEGHARYAPSTVAGLTNKGYDYWALGHIHKREKLVGPDPWIIYPGNPQGRHIREEGPRGCVLATVEGDRVTKTRFFDLDVLRWYVCSIDAGECDEADAILAAAAAAMKRLLAAADGRPVAVRIEVTGATRSHRELTRYADHWERQLRTAMLDVGDERVWVEKVKWRTRPAGDTAAWSEANPIAQLLDGVAEASSFDAALAEVREEYEQLLRHLPTDPRLAEPAIAPGDERWDGGQSAQLLREVRELLISQLLDAGERA
jgi:DNA repair exonuclease SbcCD nuclease subunit